MKKWIFPFKFWKNVQVQLMNFCYINAETKMKKMISSPQIWKKCTSAANELLFHKCRYNRKINLPLKSEKMYKWKKKLGFYFKKAETKMIFHFQIWKKCTNPANELLFHKCIKNRRMNFPFKSEKMYKSSYRVSTS